MKPNGMAGYQYQALLLAMLLLLVAHPLLRGPAGSPVLYKLLLTAVCLAVLVAELVGKRIAQSIPGEPPPADRSGESG